MMAKKRHQVQITIKEADIISRALFWYLQYLSYSDMIHCREIYDKFSRVYQILDYNQKTDNGNSAIIHYDYSESQAVTI